VTIRELCESITEQADNHYIKKLCNILGIGRSSYYYCTSEQPKSRLHAENARLKQEVIRIYNENDGVYGAPKIRIELLKLNLGFKISIRRVGKIMKLVGLRSVVIKKFRPHKTNSVYEGGENLLSRDFSTTNINQKWVSDITYIHTIKDGWCYLASIMDLATDKIIGWHFSHNMDTELVLTTLNNAVRAQQGYSQQLILHSDRGSQYTSHNYQNTVKGLNIR
jgi:transposase InsO family protein